MQTKTYFASSVPAALEVARKELGSDALLVNSRPAPDEVRAFGRLEVTFAFDPKPGAPPVRQQPPPPVNAFAPGRHSRSELDDLRQQIASLRDVVGQTAATIPAGPPAFGDFLSAAGTALDQRLESSGPIAARLCANGLEPETARGIVMAASRAPGDLQTALLHEVTQRIPVAHFGELKPGETRTLAFIGPAGRGKTTSLVKVAVQYALAKRTPVRIYSAGAHGVGGQEQLARYAASLGVPFQAHESLESLHLSLNGDPWKGLILIDTPGISRAEGAEISALATFFSRRPEIEKHLVLRADTRFADMAHMVSGFAALAPSRLLFTGLDEALTLGAMVEILARTGIPAAFAGTGQQIPEDIEDASAAKWAATVCSAGNSRAVAAAA